MARWEGRYTQGRQRWGMLDKVGKQSNNLKKDSGTVEWRAYIILQKEASSYSVLEIFAIFTRIM